jgi:RNA-directed DNA polymerase
MSARKALAKQLALAMFARDWAPEALGAAVAETLPDQTASRLQALAAEVYGGALTPYVPPPRRLAAAILQTEAFEQIFIASRKDARPVAPVTLPGRMAPLAPFAALELPQLATPGDLADWLQVPPKRLEWFADTAGRTADTRDEALRHYSWAWLPRRGAAPRLIEAPKAEMKRIQRQILREILDPVPCHRAAEGFRKGRSCLTHAQRHAGERLVIAADLRNFFLKVPLARVHGLFRCLGYPWPVARLLTGLCSASLPRQAFEELPQTDLPAWRTSVAGAWICALRVWRAASRRSTRAMPTTWPFPAVKSWRHP